MFASRMSQLQKSFIREILKATADPDVISFAGGLPNPDFFPVDEISAATQQMLAADGAAALQYAPSEGYRPLREWIAARYAAEGVQVSSEEILIINGSQQGFDLLGKVLLDEDDRLIIEKPAYLGAIQAFQVYQPEFVPVPLLDDGIDLECLQRVLQDGGAKMFYTVPNFQNPSGLTYTAENRAAVAELLHQQNVILVEDDPYGALRFSGQAQPMIRSFYEGWSVSLGTFSKMVAPGLRMGWIVAPRPLMEKLLVAKQACDLHSNYFSQRVLYQYLQNNDLDSHLEKIRAFYGRQCKEMLDLLTEQLPPEVQFTRPEGGMFIWVTLPKGMDALALFKRTAAQKVVFVPGVAFHVDGTGVNTLRLNFSNADPAQMVIGIKRFARVVKEMVQERVTV